VANAVQDWLSKGLRGHDPHTIGTLTTLAEQHVVPLIGAAKLKELTADDVDDWLDGLTDRLASSSLHRVHSILKRAIRQAQARDRVFRNVAELVSTPKGKPGRPSKAMTLAEAERLFEHAAASRMHAYVIVSVLTGIRTEEARALEWSHIVAWVASAGEWQPVTDAGFDHERFAIYVWRSVRADGDTKTGKSGARWNCPAKPRKRSRSTARGSSRSGWRPGRYGKNITWCSQPIRAPRSTPPTCAACSG
jgi:hypothetical protein